MARPDRKLSVTPETRKKWLQRHEENGESPSHIADKEVYDIRTVRKQLDLARQERESREARLMVLREAAQAHYGDLCKCAAAIESALDGRSFGVIGTEDRMCLALRQHLPRAPLWKYFQQWNNLQQDLEQTRADLRSKYKDDLSKDPQLTSAFASGKEDIPAMVDFFAKQTEFWSHAGSGVDIAQVFKPESAGEGLVNLRLGGYNIGTVAESRVNAVKKALLGFRKRLPTFAEYDRLVQRRKELDELAPEIREELAIITLRRVVPGRCKYCPI